MSDKAIKTNPAVAPPKQNSACCDGCDCACCKSSCPYQTVIAFIEQLKGRGVHPDTAAALATNFVAAQCCGTPQHPLA